MPASAKPYITPSGLVNQIDDLIEKNPDDPNGVVRPSGIWIQTGSELFALSLGAFQEHYDIRRRYWQIISREVNYNFDKHSQTFHTIYFDNNLGLFVNCDITRSETYSENKWTKTIHSYAGPEGFSKTPDGSLGRFFKHLRFDYNILNTPIVYDQKLSRFVRIDFTKEIVTKGPQVEYQIVQVGRVKKNENGISGPNWTPPRKRITKEKRRRGQDTKKYSKLVSAVTDMGTDNERDWEPVLEKSGLIFKLDRETLELSGTIGYLGGYDPDKLFAYDVKGFSVDGKHEGLLVGCVGADVFRPRLLVFDKIGTSINYKDVKINFKEFGGGPALSIANYVLETLQPAIFGLISYFTTYSFDGADGPRSLFILPNSHIARSGGKRAANDITKYAVCIGMLFPSLIIGVLLAGRVERDAKVVGLSTRARFWWIIITVVFGLSAYITYRLTRPKDTLVSCVNCGCMRRPDMERCHQCQSLWNVPELVAPMWRVIQKD
jgi:hypothetical protein